MTGYRVVSEEVRLGQFVSVDLLFEMSFNVK